MREQVNMKSTLDKELDKIEQDMQKFQSNILNMVNFDYRVPNGFDRRMVRGKLGSLFKVRDLKRYGVAVESVVGGRLFNVVV